MWRPLLAAVSLAVLSAGALLHAAHEPGAGDAVWAVSTGLILVPLVVSVVRSLLRRDVGVDAIALVAIVTALALGEFLAGAVVALMLAGGNALEFYATRRAGRELKQLLARTPRIAHRRRGGSIEEVAVDELRAGDVVVVRAGEIVPVDGTVASSAAVLDESALTGEALPVRIVHGGGVRSGSSNAGEAFDLAASRSAADSTYSAIVRLVERAAGERAPLVRLADRYAAVFLPVTLVTAGAAWLVSSDPVRFLAVMVVATPCPLILAAPIAFVAGVSRAARSGVIVKGATVIERLGEARSVLLDKTGTLTLGLPSIERVVPFDGMPPEEVLRLAASVDQLSAHVLAEALVHAAEERGLPLTSPDHVEEGRGRGIEGTVGARRVAVGSSSWLAERGYAGAEKAAASLDGDGDANGDAGKARILVGVDGTVVGGVVMGDAVRDDAHSLVDSLRANGIRHVAMVTGDRAPVAAAVAAALGIDDVHAELDPADKLEVVRAFRERPVVMVGDGVNDAPALALADVGIAMGGPGATVSSETADAVIVLDRVDRIVDAIRIGRRSLGIARQSILAGMALSLVAMGFAAAGLLAPVEGALLQEVIDVAVIANALRALRG